MTTIYKISRLNDAELESAIELMKNEHPIITRNTPLKMSSLIESELDVKVDLSRLKSFLGFTENYENESLKTEIYGNNQSTSGFIEEEWIDN